LPHFSLFDAANAAMNAIAENLAVFRAATAVPMPFHP
jgi:hypothetical protein